MVSSSCSELVHYHVLEKETLLQFLLLGCGPAVEMHCVGISNNSKAGTNSAKDNNKVFRGLNINIFVIRDVTTGCKGAKFISAISLRLNKGKGFF